MKQKGTAKNLKGAKRKDKDMQENLKDSPSNPKGTKANPKGAVSVPLPGAKGVHIGYTLGRLLKKLDMSSTHLAQLLHISPKSARAMLKKKYLHAATLVKISEALNHDVVRYLYLPEHLPGSPALKQRVEELEKEMEALKKENEMLSELNRLLKKK